MSKFNFSIDDVAEDLYLVAKELKKQCLDSHTVEEANKIIKRYESMKTKHQDDNTYTPFLPGCENNFNDYEVQTTLRFGLAS